MSCLSDGPVDLSSQIEGTAPEFNPRKEPQKRERTKGVTRPKPGKKSVLFESQKKRRGGDPKYPAATRGQLEKERKTGGAMSLLRYCPEKVAEIRGNRGQGTRGVERRTVGDRRKRDRAAPTPTLSTAEPKEKKRGGGKEIYIEKKEKKEKEGRRRMQARHNPKKKKKTSDGHSAGPCLLKREPCPRICTRKKKKKKRRRTSSLDQVFGKKRERARPGGLFGKEKTCLPLNRRKKRGKNGRKGV